MFDWTTEFLQWLIIGPLTWQHWLTAYCVVGYLIVMLILFVGLVFRLLRRLFAKSSDRDLAELLKAAQAMSNKHTSVIKDIAIWNVMAIAWPIVCGLAIKSSLDSLRSKINGLSDSSSHWCLDEPEPQFECGMDDLIERVDHFTVANQNLIQDPLGRTPSKPFGHLNPKWVRFIEGFNVADAMWSFHIKPNAVGQLPLRKMRKGFAIVRDGKVVDEMFVEWA
jgi:hypothetical protein